MKIKKYRMATDGENRFFVEYEIEVSEKKEEGKINN